MTGAPAADLPPPADDRDLQEDEIPLTSPTCRLGPPREMSAPEVSALRQEGNEG